jgi:hypothetical protein
MDDFMVQVDSISSKKTDILEGGSSGAYLKKLCSSLGCLGLENVKDLRMTFLDECYGGLRHIWMQPWRWLKEVA